MNIAPDTSSTIAGGRVAELVDPGWADRRDEATALMSAIVLLATVCALLINWLGWPVGGLLALALYLGGLRLAWRAGVGGSS